MYHIHSIETLFNHQLKRYLITFILLTKKLIHKLLYLVNPTINQYS